MLTTVGLHAEVCAPIKQLHMHAALTLTVCKQGLTHRAGQLCKVWRLPPEPRLPGIQGVVVQQAAHGGVPLLGICKLDDHGHISPRQARLAVVSIYSILRLCPLAELDKGAACTWCT